MIFPLESGILRAGRESVFGTLHAPDHFDVGASTVAEGECSTKRCNKCKKFLPRTAFTSDRSRRDGLRKMCRECVRPYYNYKKIVEKRQADRAADPAPFRAKDREYYRSRIATDPEFKRRAYEWSKKRREADPVAAREYMREYHARRLAEDPVAYKQRKREAYLARKAADPNLRERQRANEERRRKDPEYLARRREYQRLHRARNPEQKLAVKHNRRQRQANAPGRGVSAEEWRELLDSSCGVCVYCNQRKKLSLDHVDAILNGGAHDVDNLAPVCISCNSSKSTTPLIVWLARRAVIRASTMSEVA